MNTGSRDFFNRNSYTFPSGFDTPIVVTDNLKSAENLGNIIRLAGNTGCLKVLAVNEGELPRLSKIKRTAEVAGSVVEWLFCTQEEVWKHIPSSYTPVALETSAISKNIFECKLPQKAAFFAGNEISGLSSCFLNKIELHVHIPVTGIIKSLNVSHATAICLFEWMRQMQSKLHVNG